MVTEYLQCIAVTFFSFLNKVYFVGINELDSPVEAIPINLYPQNRV